MLFCCQIHRLPSSLLDLSRPLSEEIAYLGVQVFLKTHHLPWIPGHCNLYNNAHNNAQADFLANKGAMLTHGKIQKISFHTARQFLKYSSMSDYQQELLNKIGYKYGKNWVQDIPDKMNRHHQRSCNAFHGDAYATKYLKERSLLGQ